MILSEVSVRRPVLAAVLSLLLIAFGLVAYERLPLREYPDIDPPIISVQTTYPGAAANVVETRITQILDERISGVLGRGQDGYLVRLGDVARVVRGTAEDRTLYRGNAVAMVGLGIIKQSTANTIAVAAAAKAEAQRINPTLPAGLSIKQSYDSSVFVAVSCDFAPTRMGQQTFKKAPACGSGSACRPCAQASRVTAVQVGHRAQRRGNRPLRDHCGRSIP